MMENLIKRILEIDRDAKEKMSEAVKKRADIISEAEAEKEKMICQGIADAEKRLEDEQSDGRKKADEKIAVITAEKDKETARLEKIYESRHKEWEDNIYKAVINS